jgi:hypothetical protein
MTWVWVLHIPGVLGADEMDLEMMFTIEAAAIIWKLPTEKVVV